MSQPSPTAGSAPAHFARGAVATLCVLLALTAAFPALAVTGKPLRFDRLSLEDGLSQASVLTVFQDSRGFMWFGTEDGLNRFDGYTFTQYKHDRDDPGSLASDFVWAIDEDAEGHLWFAVEDGGVARLDREDGQFVAYRHVAGDPTGLASDAARAVHIDADGAVWVGLQGAGLERLDPKTGRATHHRHDPLNPGSLSGDDVFVVYSDRSGNLWVGTDSGLNRFDRKSNGFERFRHDPENANSLSSDRVRALFEDNRGFLWIGTRDGGLNRLDRNTGSVVRYVHDPDDPSSLAHDRVRAILEDNEQRLWIGTARGLNLLDRATGKFTRYQRDPADPTSLGDDTVLSLFQDRGGMLWVGTRSGGVCKWSPRTWSFGHYAASAPGSKGLTNPNVLAFSEDRDGVLWVGTFGGGLFAIDRATGDVRSYTHDPDDPSSLGDDRVMALLHDRDGVLWVGTMTGGLNRMESDTGTFRAFRHDPEDATSLGADGVMALFEDREGRLWVGTFGGGAARFDRESESFTRFEHVPSDPGSLSNPRVTAFAQDGSGALWIGTEGGGLNLLVRASGTFLHFRHDPENRSSLSADTVYSLHVDAKGALWVGTRDGGLDRLMGNANAPDRIRFENFSEADGLDNAVIYGIRPDDRGHLWLSTNHGLSRFHPRTGDVKNYHRSHGLQNEEFNFGAHFRSPSGELFFGGPNGFNAFFPDRLKANPDPPAVVLTAFEKLNRPAPTEVPLSSLERVELGFRDDVVTFEFAALDFAAPAENRYAYMLEGFDPDWIELGNRRRVTYTNLDHGDYVLWVKAANSDGVWNERGIALQVAVEPAPWRSGWAYSAYVLAGLAAAGSLWRANRNKRRREHEYTQRLEEEVRDRTRELNDRNAELESLNNRLLEASLTDPLTGLRNRRFLFENVAKDIAMVRRCYHNIHMDHEEQVGAALVFMMVDLDHFKSINDSCGHAAGDQILLQVRDELLQACRCSDIVIRWGGDEFLVLARGTNADEADALAERIRSMIEERVFDLPGGQVARTTCSIGYACYPFLRSQADRLSWEQVMTIADSALYRAKEHRNAWVGYLSTTASPGADNLFLAIRNETDRLVSEGRLEIRDSTSRPGTRSVASRSG